MEEVGTGAANEMEELDMTEAESLTDSFFAWPPEALRTAPPTRGTLVWGKGSSYPAGNDDPSAAVAVVAVRAKLAAVGLIWLGPAELAGADLGGGERPLKAT